MKSWLLGGCGALAAAPWLISCGGNSTAAAGTGGSTAAAGTGGSTAAAGTGGSTAAAGAGGSAGAASNAGAASGGKWDGPTSTQGGNAQAGGGGMSGARTISEIGCDTSKACGEAYALLPCSPNLNDFSIKCTGEVHIDRFSSSCGGTVIRADAYVYSQAWTFSSTGELVGTSTSADLVRLCFGTSCSPLLETRQVLCDFATTGSNSGAGGVGGDASGGAGDDANGGAGGDASGGAG